DYVFTDSIQYIENYAEFIGQRIADHGSKDLKYIASLLGGHHNSQPNSQNLFISTLFDWVNPKKEMWVSSSKGVFDKPIDMSHRDYLNRTPKYPWTLQIQDPAKGIPSGQWIIPGGMGITNSKGEYLGAVTLGFAIDGLAKKINSALGNNDLQFVILNNDLKYIGGTSGGRETDDAFFFIRYFENKNEILNNNANFFKKPIEFSGAKFYHYYKTSKYGFIILSGYDESLPLSIFNNVLLPRLMEFAVLGSIALLLLFIVRQRLIKPLIALSHATDSISRGEKVKKLPRSQIREIRNLSTKLIGVMRHMNKEKRHKQQLSDAKEEVEKAVAIARESKAAKEAFVKKIRHELRQPLNLILGYSEAMMREEFGKLSDKYRQVAEDIFTSGHQVGSLMTSVLNRKYIKTTNVINECIAVYKDHAYCNGIEYSSEIPETLPDIFVDEIRFRQIIVGTIYHSLSLTPESETVKITAKASFDEDNKPKNLVINVKDTGFGGSEEFRIGAVDRNVTRASDSDETKITIADIRTLLTLHKGDLNIESSQNNGTMFTITIPYLSNTDPDDCTDDDFADFKNVTPLFRK
ncbi:ATP-binding protein, partial [Rickettsiales bacterium]|nr:ATP-binding protein [Rickettsiales bacterium]